MLHKLADVANWLGQRCIARVEQLQARVDELIARAKFWKDIETWLRNRRSKPLREIREERVLREAE